MMKYIKICILRLFTHSCHQSGNCAGKNLYGPYLQNLKEDEATIVCIVNKPSIGWVELVPNGGTHYYEGEQSRYFNTT